MLGISERGFGVIGWSILIERDVSIAAYVMRDFSEEVGVARDFCVDIKSENAKFALQC